MRRRLEFMPRRLIERFFFGWGGLHDFNRVLLTACRNVPPLTVNGAELELIFTNLTSILDNFWAELSWGI